MARYGASNVFSNVTRTTNLAYFTLIYIVRLVKCIVSLVFPANMIHCLFLLIVFLLSGIKAIKAPKKTLGNLLRQKKSKGIWVKTENVTGSDYRHVWDYVIFLLIVRLKSCSIPCHAHTRTHACTQILDIRVEVR